MSRPKALYSSLAAIAVVSALAACSSGSSDSGRPTIAGTSTSAPASDKGSSANSLLAQAQATAEAATQNPTGLTITTPLSKKPPTGKLIVSLQLAQVTSAMENQAAEQAAAVFGWKYKVITEGSGPQDPITAFQSAIAMHPDAIHYSGTPTALIKAQLAEAKADGIVVIPDAVADPLTPPMINNTITGPAMASDQGKDLADYVTWRSGGKANIQAFTLPVYPILGAFDKGFTTELARVCPQCEYHANPQQLTDVGTNTPNNVVSVLQKNPDANWLVFSLGAVETGVLPALKAAGLASKVTIGGITPEQGQMAELKAGQNEVWSGFSSPMQGWTYIDALARYWSGDQQVTAALPHQLITTANVNSIAVNSSGYYIGFAGYQAAFKKLWGFSS
jgi:ribose transport system substrate-binding protein